MRSLIRHVALFIFASGLIAFTIWARAGAFGFHALARHGGTYWLPVDAKSAKLPPAMRMALAGEFSVTAGKFSWFPVTTGFDTGELPVLADGREVDRIYLARIEPANFKFAVFNAPAGDTGLDDWMKKLGAALVVNGSYYAHDGRPDTPFLSEDRLLGPAQYDARAGAFISSASFTGIRNLSRQGWQDAFKGADNAMVSYPLLVADGATHVPKPSQWLANRSFIAQDKQGRIIIGTTRDAFFTLARLANFLRDAPLDIETALNLDGGPVASQAISLNGYRRTTYGQWELQMDGGRGKLLTYPYGKTALPIVLAVFPK